MSAGLVLLLAALALVLLAGLILRFTAFSEFQVRRLRFRTRFHMKPGPGFASMGELWFRWGRLAALHHGGRARPSMSYAERVLTPATAYATRLGRAQWGKRVYARDEDQVLIYAPPRTGKTALLGDQLADWPGPVVVHESRPDLLAGTAGYRARFGCLPEVFNPEGLGGYPSTFRWDILGGCQNADEAFYRATDLGAAAVADFGEMQWWVDKGAGALAAGMYLGSLRGATMDDVYEWASAPALGSPLVRDAAGMPGVSRQMLAGLPELERPGKMADSIRGTMAKSLQWMRVSSLRDSVAGPGAEPFDVPGWLEARGTLYLVSPGGEEAPSAPLLRCLASYVHRQARMVSQSLPGRKLDPRLLFALDELHRCPVDLPGWLGDSAGAGIKVVAVVHSTGQLEKKYGREGLETVWATTGTKLFLPGIHEERTLRDVSALCGRLPGYSGDGKQDWVAPPEFITRLPDLRALVLRLNLTPTIVKVRPFWRRWPARLGRAPAMPVLEPVAVPAAEVIDITGRVPALAAAEEAAGE